MKVLNVMIVGRTGNGKSSTGNSLVTLPDEKGRDVFITSGNTESETKGVKAVVSEIDGHPVKIIDTPGLKDTGDIGKGDVDQSNMRKYMQDALKMCDQEIHLFLFVLKYGSRFTEEECQVLTDFLKASKKEEMLNRSAVVITNGDDFRLKEKDREFMDWCKDPANGQLSELIEQVGSRAILFENVRATDEQKKEQRKKVLQLGLEIRAEYGGFTYTAFRESLIILSKIASYCNIL